MNLKRLPLKIKIYIISVIVSVLVILTYSSVHHFIFANESNKMALSTAYVISKKKQKLIDRFFDSSRETILYVKKSDEFKNYIDSYTKKNIHNLNQFITHIMSVDKSYMQMRFIDKNGMEKINIKRETLDTAPKIIKTQKLQNKSNRYYFKKGITLEKGEFWFSDIDLNMENNKIEIPYKPTMRIVYPVFKNDKKEGILVINYFMDYFLMSLSKSPLYDVIVCNKNGVNIIHYENNKSWGAHKKENYNIKDEYEDYAEVLSNKYYRTDKLLSIKYDVPLENGLYMILQLKKEYVEFNRDKKIEETIITSILAILISIVGSLILVKIVQKVLLNKDKMIFEQNKLASMGQMLENIAHQWRQPLAQINSIVYTMDYEINKQNLDKAVLLKELDRIETVTTYLSETINDFKDFLKIDKEKKTFSLIDSLQKTVSIIEASFSYYDIEININLKNDFRIYNYQNLLEQSVLSILNNSKDALTQKKVQNPKVSIDINETNNDIEIIISDNGGGIKIEPFEKIFEPYFTTKHQTKGTGLGLYISKMMIEEGMGGEISVRNTSKGASFKISLLKGSNGK